MKKGQIKVIKVDADNNEIKLEGVEFEVLDSNGNVLEKIITNENGEALTQRYPIRDFEKLTLKEVKTGENYILNDKPQTIVLKENEIENVVFENEPIKGKVEITKVDKKDHSKVLKGAKFGLYNAKGELLETLVTDKDGKALSKELYKSEGPYYLKELETGSVYYLLNEDTFEFEIINNGETIPIIIENEPTDIEVDVDKEGSTEIKPGEEVNYTFSNVANNSNVKTILGLCGAAAAEMADHSAGRMGTLRLGAISSVHGAMLLRWLEAYARRYPEVRLDLHNADTYQQLELIRTGQIDVALVRTPFSAPELAQLQLAAERMLAVALPGQLPPAVPLEALAKRCKGLTNWESLYLIPEPRLCGG